MRAKCTRVIYPSIFNPQTNNFPVKSARTTPSKRVRELCDELQDNLEPGESPSERRVQNHFDRKFGCSGQYRSVENATAECLKMSRDEYMEFMKKQYDQMFKK